MNYSIVFTLKWILAFDVASEKSDVGSDSDDAKSAETADGSNSSHKKKKKKEKVKIAQFFDFNKFSKRKYLVGCWWYSTSSGQGMQKTGQCVGGCGQWRC